MRAPFAHAAVVTMDAGGDDAAPGAAITVALCGHWEHEPPCPLAPHHTTAERADGRLALRVLFAAEPDDEAEVRTRIEAALSAGRLAGTGDGTTRWRLRDGGPSPIREDEHEHAARLVGG